MAAAALTKVNNWKVFGGQLTKFKHMSVSTGSEMVFSVFLPSLAANRKVPVVYWLSGLTCTDDNFMQKAGAFEVAEQLGVALVAPDTSPRELSSSVLAGLGREGACRVTDVNAHPHISTCSSPNPGDQRGTQVLIFPATGNHGTLVR